ESEPLEQAAADACQRLLGRIDAALTDRRASVLSEDYLVFAVTSSAPADGAEDVLDRHGADIAQLLRGERQTLARQERDEVLRNRLSYLDDDLVVPAWNATFIADTEPAVLAAIEILEFANSQLLEYRYHDDLLDTELAGIYSRLQQPRWTD